MTAIERLIIQRQRDLELERQASRLPAKTPREIMQDDEMDALESLDTKPRGRGMERERHD
ncbi:MAG: hypothetical protein F4Y18_02750 [Cenarchaeum sp. SB0663_bin_5]|nr:hypothetical protein [Cenarchaeum sp. SB0663_bin_5]MYL11501.1 hypothetical protein [Cenarchaeum sp. SB0669_bin_11]